MWICYGVLSVVFALLPLIRSIKQKNHGAVLMSFLSLFCAMALMLDFMWMIRDWVIKEDWAALSDVVPVLTTMLAFAVICCVLINMVTIIRVSIRKKKMQASS